MLTGVISRFWNSDTHLLEDYFFLGTGMLTWWKDGAEADLPGAINLVSSDHKKGKMIIAVNNI
jgi:hypothetical protein